MNRDDFDQYNDPEAYFLKEDALRSLDYDVYFSLGKRYFCDAGCHVCYIKDNLKELKPYAKSLYPTITKHHERIWYQIADYFGSVRINDDLFWLRDNVPAAYEWYMDHADRLDYCMTDNAIFREADILHLFKFNSVADISLSSEFVRDVGSKKIMEALNHIRMNHEIKKIKFIDCGQPELLQEFVFWAKEHNMHNCLHHDFRADERKVYNYDWAEYQNTWVESHNSNLLKVYRESVALYYDDFYYSCDDASDVDVKPFHNIGLEFNPERFMAALVNGKIEQYKHYKERSKIDAFKQYFDAATRFKVNPTYNFIPGFMFSPTSRFMYKLIENGWTQTPYGLFDTRKDMPVTAIVERI